MFTMKSHVISLSRSLDNQALYQFNWNSSRVSVWQINKNTQQPLDFNAQLFAEINIYEVKITK